MYKRLRQGKFSNPLGYIQLESGPVAIEVMNNMFTNYHFNKEENWEDLRSIANIFINGYKSAYKDTVLEPIEGDIVVETQYEKFKDQDGKLKRQDFKIMGKDVTYMELQNKAYPEMPIEAQAVEYYGMGIANNGRQLSNQLWLMAEDLPKLMHGRKYVNYILKDEETDIIYPKTSGIMLISLTKISEENADSPQGELAAFLLGMTADIKSIKDANVRRIAAGFNKGFRVFKLDKGVEGVMTVREKWTMADRIEGRREGMTIGKVEMCYRNFGMTTEEIASKLDMSEKVVREILEEIGLLQNC